MYHKTVEEEEKFLCSLWDVFDAWVSKKHPNAELGTEVEGQKINLEDDDVQAIIRSITIK